MLSPIKKNVIVELIQKEKVTASGIVLASADRDEVSRGVVIAIGPDVTDVAVDDVILANWNAARKTKYEDKEYYIVPEDQIVLIFEE